MEKASVTFSSPRQTDSIHALKLRATADIDRLKSVAVYNGYFDASIEFTLIDLPVPQITFHVNLGNRFYLGGLTIIWGDKDVVEQDLLTRNESVTLTAPTPSDCPSFRKNTPATGEILLSLDKELITSLKERAFAFCKIMRKEIKADRLLSQVDVTLFVQTGPIVRFGPTQIIGADHVENSFFLNNLYWKESDLYSPTSLAKTERALQQSGLFQSVQVEEGSNLGKDWSLPIIITVTEAKPRTVGLGINYTTTLGPGVSAEWEHRNIHGLGRKLSTNLELWQRQRIAKASYTLPHFGAPDQNLLWVVEYDQQNYLPFESSAIKGSSLLDRKVTPRTDVLLGPGIERLESKGIIGNQLYHLAKFFLQLRWSSANSPLDPTRGLAISVKLTPAHQYLSPTFSYLIHTTSLAWYHSVFHDRCTFAARFAVGNITGAAKNTIPLPDRFFGACENSLRGYKTGTVSPLDDHGQPKGGRSTATASFETRIRTQGPLGWVLFYDIGNVFQNVIPEKNNLSLLHSAGIGVRYATPIGPLRLDFAVPFQRRKHIDPPFQIYFSIGQAF